MAAPSSNPRFVDPFKPGKYPVIVSERLLNDTNDPHDSLISVERRSFKSHSIQISD